MLAAGVAAVDNNQINGLVWAGFGVVGLIGQMTWALIKHPIFTALAVLNIGIGGAAYLNMFEMPEWMRFIKEKNPKKSDYASYFTDMNEDAYLAEYY